MQVNQGREFIGRFPHKADLLFSLTDLCKKESIRLAVFSVIGALDGVALGYYRQDRKEYAECLKLQKKLEITSCIGNVSLQEGEIFVHAHVNLADHQGASYGGHLMPGSVIFAAEYYIKELTGTQLERVRDSQTGLSLWP